MDAIIWRLQALLKMMDLPTGQAGLGQVDFTLARLHIQEALRLAKEESAMPPAPEPLSVLTTGPVAKPWESSLGMPDAATVNLVADGGWLVLTVRTGEGSKSVRYTPREWETICRYFWTPPSTSESPTPSTKTTPDGVPGLVQHESSSSPLSCGNGVHRWPTQPVGRQAGSCYCGAYGARP